MTQYTTYNITDLMDQVSSYKYGLTGELDANGELNLQSIQTEPVPTMLPLGTVYLKNGRYTPLSSNPQDPLPPLNISYSFPTDIPPKGEHFQICEQLSPENQEMVHKTLTEISKRFNIRFQQEPETHTTTIKFIGCDFITSQELAAGKADFPKENAYNAILQMSYASAQVLIPGGFHPTGSYFNPSPQARDGQQALTHEIGHSLGLEHTHNQEPSFPHCAGVMAYAPETSILIALSHSTDKFGPNEEFKLDTIYGPNPNYHGTINYELVGNNQVKLPTSCKPDPITLLLAWSTPFTAQIVFGVIAGVVSSIPACKTDKFFPPTDGQEATYSQYAAGILRDGATSTFRYVCPLAAETRDLVHCAIKTRKACEGQKKKTTASAIAGTVATQYATHVGCRLISQYLGPISLSAIYYAQSPVSAYFETKKNNPAATTQEILTTVAKKTPASIIKGTRGVRYAVPMLTKAARSIYEWWHTNPPLTQTEDSLTDDSHPDVPDITADLFYPSRRVPDTEPYITPDDPDRFDIEARGGFSREQLYNPGSPNITPATADILHSAHGHTPTQPNWQETIFRQTNPRAPASLHY